MVVATVLADMETAATALRHGRCFLLSVPPVVKTRKCLFNPVVTDQSTVQIVTAKPTR